MTMAPGQRKRGFWLEVIFISLLLFLLMGGRQHRSRETGVPKIGSNPSSVLHGLVPDIRLN